MVINKYLETILRFIGCYQDIEGTWRTADGQEAYPAHCLPETLELAMNLITDYEYNPEFDYIYDTKDTLEALPEGFTAEEVYKVYYEEAHTFSF